MICSSLGFNHMAQVNPVAPWWNEQHPYLQMATMCEQNKFVSAVRTQEGHPLGAVLWPRIVGKLEEMGDTEALAVLEEIGVITSQPQGAPPQVDLRLPPEDTSPQSS